MVSRGRRFSESLAGRSRPKTAEYRGDTLANAQEIPTIIPKLDCQTTSAPGTGKGCRFRVSRLAEIHLADQLTRRFTASLTRCPEQFGGVITIETGRAEVLRS